MLLSPKRNVRRSYTVRNLCLTLVVPGFSLFGGEAGPKVQTVQSIRLLHTLQWCNSCSIFFEVLQ